MPANAVKIANLEIEISDNSKTTVQSLTEFIDTLKSLREATANGGGLKKVASGLKDIKDVGSGGIHDLRRALAGSINPAEKLARAMERIASANRKISGSSNLAKATQTANNLQNQVNNAVSASNRRSGLTDDTAGMANGLSDATQTANKAMEDFNSRCAEAKAKLEAMQLKDNIAQEFKQMADEAAKTYGKTNKISESLQKVGNGIKSVGNFGKNIFGQLLPSSLMTLGSQFLRLAKMKIMRAVISNLMQGFTEGLQNAYQWAKATGDQFALSMDSIATSMNWAKNSIGAAFSGVLNAVAPIIDRLVDWLVKGINYVNAFFAALSGQSTYMRAKRVATAYADVGNSVGGIGGAAGGATAKVKELEEQLSVLDFDELNQLQEQPTYTPSGGGGGGGGGGGAGGSGSNAADMFERASIGNEIMQKANWLKENFADILDYVKAIGLGILAWKITNALANNIDALKNLSLKKKVGIALMVAGFTLEYEGAYGLGYNGFNLADMIKTAIGASLGIAGSLLVFGTGPLGWTIGIGLAITTFIVGFSMGKWQAIKDELQATSESYQMATRVIEDATNRINTANNTLSSLRVQSIMDNDEFRKWTVASELLNKIRKFEGVQADPSTLGELQLYVDQLNQILSEAGLSDYVQVWTDANGAIQTNAESIQLVIDKMMELAKFEAMKDLFAQNVRTIAEADVDTKVRQEQNKELQKTIDENQAIVDAYESDIGDNGIFGKKFNQEDYDNYLKAVAEVEHSTEAINKNNEAIALNNDIVAEAEAKNKIYTEAMFGEANAANQANDAIKKLNLSLQDRIALSKYGVSSFDWIPTSDPKLDQYLQQNKPKQGMYAGMMGYSGGTSTTTNNAVYTTSGVEQATAQTQQYTSAVYDNNNALSLTHAYQDALSSGNIEMAEAIRRGSQAITDNTVAQQVSLPIMKLMYNGYSDLSNGMYQGVTAGRSYTNQMYASADAESAVGTASKSAGFQLSAFDKYLLSVGNTSNTTVRGVNLMNTGLYNIGTTSKTSSVNVGLINKALNAVGVGVDYGGIASLITTNLGKQRWTDTANKMKNPVESRFNLTGNDVNYKGIYSSMSSLMLKQPFGNMGTSMKGKIEATANQTGMGFASGSIYSRISTALGKQPFGTPGTNAKNSMEKTMNQTGAGLNAKNIYSVIQKKINSQPFGNLATPMKNNMEKVMNQIGSGFNVKAIYNTIAKGFDAQPWSQIGNRMGNDLRNGLQSVTNQLTDLPRSLCQAMQGAANNAPFSRVGNTIGNDIKQGIRQAVQNINFDVTAKANGVTKQVSGNARTELYASGGYPQSGSLFVAGEAGAEAVGTIGGRTAVANREQIASAIAQALRPMIGNRNESETIQVNTYLDSQVVARANAKGVKAMNRRYNITAKA